MSGPISEDVEAALAEGSGGDTVSSIVREATTSLRAFEAGMKLAKHMKMVELEQHLDQAEMDIVKLRKLLKEAPK